MVPLAPQLTWPYYIELILLKNIRKCYVNIKSPTMSDLLT